MLTLSKTVRGVVYFCSAGEIGREKDLQVKRRDGTTN